MLVAPCERWLPWVTTKEPRVLETFGSFPFVGGSIPPTSLALSRKIITPAGLELANNLFERPMTIGVSRGKHRRLKRPHLA